MSEILDELKTFTEGFETKLNGAIRKVDEIDALLKRPGSGGYESKDGGGDWCESMAKKLHDDAGFQAFAKSRHAGRLILQLDGGALPMERKTVDSAALGFSTPGVLSAERVAGIVPLARRRLTIRDLIQARPCSGSQVDFIRENAFTNTASPQTESSAKGESGETFTIGSARVTTIATWIPASRQVLDDVGELQTFLSENLLYAVKLKEETELLSGDGLGSHLSGLIGLASAYAGSFDSVGDQKIDRLRKAIAELEVSDNSPNGIILNPSDFAKIELLKTDVGGSNTGSYIAADPLGTGVVRVPTLWGRPVIVTNSISSAKFLVGDFTKCAIFDRMQAVIDVSSEHSDFFIKNLVAVRCEERLAFACFRPSAFLYGSLP